MSAKTISLYLLHLDLVLHVLYQSLQSTELSSVSAESLQKVCTSCQKRMAPHFTILLQIVQAIDSLSISASAILEFFQGICGSFYEKIASSSTLRSSLGTPISPVATLDQ